MMARRGRASPRRGPAAGPRSGGGVDCRRPWPVWNNRSNSRPHESGLGPPRQGLDMTTIVDPLITEAEAADILRVSLTSLRRWRREGRGPVYRKLGRSVRYRPDDLADFIAASLCTET